LTAAYSPGVCLANLDGCLTAASPALRLTGILKDVTENKFIELSFRLLDSKKEAES
jgi:hypothetical protein